MSKKIQNLNPFINTKLHKYDNEWLNERKKLELDDNVEDKIDKYEVFEIIRTITDPEHPYNLEELKLSVL